MTQMRLNLNLPPKLMLHSTLQQLTLTQYLERNNILCSTLTSEVDLAKLSSPEWLSDFEILKRPSSPGLGGLVHCIIVGSCGGGGITRHVVVVVVAAVTLFTAMMKLAY